MELDIHYLVAFGLEQTEMVLTVYLASYNVSDLDTRFLLEVLLKRTQRPISYCTRPPSLNQLSILMLYHKQKLL